MERKNKNKIIYGETFTEQAPRPTPAIFDVLAQYIIAEDGAKKDELRESLNDIYKIFASLDSQLVFALNRLEKDLVISKEESLILLITVTVSIELNSDLSNLRQAIINRLVRNIDTLKLQRDTLLLNKNLSDQLFAIISKIKDKYF